MIGHALFVITDSPCSVGRRVGSILFLYGCGGDSPHTGNAANEYPAGVSEDVEQQLKYDARVESFEPDGEDLVVNVNDSWASSPQGMQERAVGQW